MIAAEHVVVWHGIPLAAAFLWLGILSLVAGIGASVAVRRHHCDGLPVAIESYAYPLTAFCALMAAVFSWLT